MGFAVVRGMSVALAVVVSLIGATALAAPTREEAKQHFEAGNALVENEDYAAAASEFELSVLLYPTKMGLFNLANCYKALNKYGDSLIALARLEREFAGKLGDLAGEVASLKNTIEGMVGRLEVMVDRDGASIMVDDADVGLSPLGEPLILAPGEHVIEARLSGYTDASRTVRIVSREKLEVSFVLEEEPAAPPAPVVAPPVPESASAQLVPAETKTPSDEPEKNNHNRAARAMGGVSVAFAVVAGAGCAFFSISGAKKADEFKDAREAYNMTVGEIENQGPTEELVNAAEQAWSEMESKREDATKNQNIGLAQGIGAGVFTVAAIVLFIVGRDKEESDEAQATVSAATGGLAVEF